MKALQVLRWRLGDAIRPVVEFFQDQWFDRTRRVRTAGDLSLLHAGIGGAERRDSEWYVPARPRHIRHALSLLPMGRNVSSYTYIDFGSGKGRSLFIAAELPFRRVVGVEFSPVLHEQAKRNIRTFRYNRKGAQSVESLHMNALCFAFPANEKLVLYLFNPFGADTMRTLMTRLADSLREQPRHVVVLLLWPRCGEQVMAVPGMRMIRSTLRLQMFEVG